jgi:prepilin-type N-terminal cleavage/methylation domain-containing protein/prepilin-type processing-associated H-X9-DG protein
MNPPAKQSRYGSEVNESGFTLTELLVVLAIICVAAGLLLEGLSLASSRAQRTQCINNIQKFALAWSLYNFASGGRLVPNDDVDDAGGNPETHTWVHGWIPLGANYPDDTNTLLLTHSLLAPYLPPSIKIWRCPSDKSTSRQGGQVLPRVRSTSMNSWLGNTEDGSEDTFTGLPTGGRTIRKVSDMVKPGPSDTFVFTDERADTICAGAFGVCMALKGRIAVLGHLPGNYHMGSGTFSFADGHVQAHKWTDQRTMPPLRNYNPFDGYCPSPLNPDADWLQAHATAAIATTERGQNP